MKIASGEVKVPQGTNPAEERRMLLAIANQPIDTATTYVTGGDVSRFQRRSVPARANQSGGQGSDPLTSFANALMGKGSAGSAPGAAQVVTGPSVRVARGNNVTVVPVGAR